MAGAFAGAGQAGAWGGFVLAYGAFLLSHMVPARPKLRAALIARLGTRGYFAAYGVLSVAMLAWLIVAAARAPFVPVLPFALWQSWAPNLLMPAALLLASYGTAAPNPLSIAGRDNRRFDPAAPGVAGLTRHPLLWAFLLWALGHALANPDLAHLLLFGGLGAFALTGMVAIDARMKRRFGREEWARLAACTSLLPGAALLTGRWRARRPPAAGRAVTALLLWAALLLLHPIVIGASPWPVMPR